MENESMNCIITEDEMHNYIHTAGYVCFGLLLTCAMCVIRLACK